MPGHSSAQAICTRVLIRARTRTALTKRYQSTFSFFSHSQDSASKTTATHPATLNPIEDKSGDLAESSRLLYPKALKTSPSYANAAPLLSAIQNKDQDTAWMVYSVMSRAGQLSSLLPIHHSLLLKSIRPRLSYRHTKEEADILIERHQHVWAGMLACDIQPDMNDYTARLELLVAIKQHSLLDLTWTEMRSKFESSSSSVGANMGGAGGGGGGRSLIQPTVYTYNLILQSCVVRKNIGKALETISLMRRMGVKPDTMSWDFVLQIYTELKDWASVESTFRAVFQTAPVGSPETLPQHHMVENLKPELMVVPLGQRVRTLHGGSTLSKNNVKGQSRVNEKEKLVPSLQNIHTLFSYYAYTQDLEDLRNMFDSHCRLFGLVPTTRTYNELIQFSFLARQDEEGMALFRELVSIGKNLEKLQSQQNKANGEDPGQNSVDQSSIQDSQDNQSIQICGPDFDTFKILINKELIASRNRWGRAWKWIRIMQDVYGLEPSDAMFRRTLASMQRRFGTESDVQALQSNWDQVRARRDGRRAGSFPSQPTPPPAAEEVEELSAAANTS
ncbi:hypothetical protein BGZ76_002964 [Entomortierella beljakovae]|nr:hypothetical protein BGZ76_002964 [Entomortierella beljakovae]